MTQTSAQTITAVAPPGSTASTTAPVTQASVAVPTTTRCRARHEASSARAHRRHHLRGVPGRDARRRSERLDGSTPQPRRGTRPDPQHLRRRLRGLHRLQGIPLCHPASRPDEPEGERIRLSEALRAVQEKVNYYLAWTQAESADIGKQYATLISEARRVAGRAMHDSWNDPPRATDPEMNIPPDLVDLSQLAAPEAEYMQAVRQHLSSLTPWWAR
jgi:hypothetical protein